MAALEIQGNGDTGNHISEESIHKTLSLLEDPRQRDFIDRCLTKNPKTRPSARDLLFHVVLFEVHSLKLLAAHALVQNSKSSNDDAYPVCDDTTVLASKVSNSKLYEYTVNDVNTLELEKLTEDVRNGVYPLTAFASITQPPASRPRAVSPELADSVKSETPEPVDTETRLIVNMQCSVKKIQENPTAKNLTLMLRMDDKMNRQLTCEVNDEDNPEILAEELVHLGFINAGDRERLARLIEDNMNHSRSPSISPQGSSPLLIEQTA